jgi:hypothetical protein
MLVPRTVLAPEKDASGEVVLADPRAWWLPEQPEMSTAAAAMTAQAVGARPRPTAGILTMSPDHRCAYSRMPAVARTR